MNDIIEIRNRLNKLYNECVSEDRSRQFILSRVRHIIEDLDKDIAEYDSYIDQMAFAAEQYEDRMVSA